MARKQQQNSLDEAEVRQALAAYCEEDVPTSGRDWQAVRAGLETYTYPATDDLRPAVGFATRRKRLRPVLAVAGFVLAVIGIRSVWPRPVKTIAPSWPVVIVGPSPVRHHSLPQPPVQTAEMPLDIDVALREEPVRLQVVAVKGRLRRNSIFRGSRARPNHPAALRPRQRRHRDSAPLLLEAVPVPLEVSEVALKFPVDGELLSANAPRRTFVMATATLPDANPAPHYVLGVAVSASEQDESPLKTVSLHPW